ncbi:zinc-ribbon domain-containing protein [Christensenellaceae bacterium OttesenSCG-928-K19]|nr:zinc-ribbon domain-containing protein [Christensenellaceae bacterium OttesenSCG-928-K19]
MSDDKTKTNLENEQLDEVNGGSIGSSKSKHFWLCRKCGHIWASTYGKIPCPECGDYQDSMLVR